MNLLDKLVLALRSAVNDAVGDDVAPVTKEEQVLRAIDKAEARLDALRDDLARAEKRGQDELAEQLRKEIDSLQKMLDKTRKRLNQIQGREPTSKTAEGAQEMKPALQKAVEPAQVQQKSDERQEAIAKPDDQAVAGDALDGTRIADMLSQKKES
jgi:vacuolar-type H+-ATPase subunit I/STV1